MFDNVEIGGDIILSGNLIMGTENGKRMIIHRNTSNNTFHIAPDLPDGNWDWSKQLMFNRDGNVDINGQRVVRYNDLMTIESTNPTNKNGEGWYISNRRRPGVDRDGGLITLQNNKDAWERFRIQMHP
jgi:hypothetical protein